MTAQPRVRCYIAIGSNQGERLALCEAAVAALAALPGITLSRRSTWYETEPVILDVGARAERAKQVPPMPPHPEPPRFSRRPPAPPHPNPAPGWFINGAVELTTTLTPHRLLDACLQIERQLGRRRMAGSVAPLSRPIDLDLLLYGDAVINEPGLTIPHPRLEHRRFVLVPLGEIAPDVIHPVLGATIADLLSRLTDSHAVRRLEPVSAAPDRPLT